MFAKFASVAVLAFSAAVGFTAPTRAADTLLAALFEDGPAASEMTACYSGDENQPFREEFSSTRKLVEDPTHEAPGVVTIDTAHRRLYLSLPVGRAYRYGVGVGREGFAWKGRTHIGRKQEWPDWTPPAAMLKRRPDLPRHMAGGKQPARRMRHVSL